MMEEKFDTEFKRKVKGINPEIPDVVRVRINDTLASLPEGRSFRRFGYLGAIAALFLVCFIGVRYMYPFGAANEKSSEAPRDMTIAASEAEGEQNQNANVNMFAMESNTEKSGSTNGEVTDSAEEDSTKEMLNSGLKVQSAASDEETYGVTAGQAQFTRGVQDGSTADDMGIQLILKTAKYDGKEIRVEFDKNIAGDGAASAKAIPRNNADVSSNSETLIQIAGVNVAKQYEVRVVVNDIPLKCSINVIETPNGENQYSGTMIIIPDSSLPENFNMILNFDKIGEATGQWLLKAQVSKE